MKLRCAALLLAINLMTSAAMIAPAQAQVANQYWLARWNEPCGLLPDVAAQDKAQAASAIMAAMATREELKAYIDRVEYGVAGGYEAMLAGAQTVLADFLDAYEASGPAGRSALAERFRPDFAMIGALLNEGAGLRNVPEPPPRDAPQAELIRHGYFSQLHRLYRYAAYAYVIMQKMMTEGPEVLSHPDAAAVVRHGPVDAAQLFAAASADRSRERLATGVFLADVADEQSMVCLMHAADMYLSAVRNRLGGGTDGAKQQAAAFSSLERWGAFAKSARSTSLEADAKNAFGEYQIAADRLAERLRDEAAFKEHAAGERDTTAVRAAVVAVMETRRLFLFALAK